MAKYLQLIGFLVLILAFCQISSDLFTDTNSVERGNSVGTEHVITTFPADNACFSSPQLPYLPDAELANPAGNMQLLTSSRVQRSYITEYIFSLRDWGGHLARREAVLSLHREKLYDATAYYPCHPVCEYYIFTLRRILI